MNRSGEGRCGIFAWLMAVLVVSLLASCISVQIRDTKSLKETDRVKGVYHRVKPGETLWRISKAYNADLQEIAELNNITDSSRITAGQAIFIPNVP